MGVLTTGNTFSTGDQVTASKLNDAVNSATLQAAAVDNTSTQLSSGAIIVKDLGITQDKIAADAVGTNELANDVVVNTSGSITGAAGSFTTLAASGVVSVPDGSESAPAITNTGDTNTGIYFPAENSVALTAGAGATLTSTNTAITIDVPTSIVSTAQSDLTLQGGDANSKNLIFKKASAQQGKIAAVGDELKFYAGTSGTESLEITTTGVVIPGTISVTGLIKQSGDTGSLDIQGGDTAGANIELYGASHASHANDAFYDADSHVFRPANGSSSRVIINSSGNVGIGTASPSEELEVSATGVGLLVRNSDASQEAGIATVRGQRSDTNTSPASAGGMSLESWNTSGATVVNEHLGSVYFGANHTSGSESNILATASIAGIAEGTFSNSSTMPSGIAFRTGSAGQAIGVYNQFVGEAERMRIDSSGNVGIGTATPEHSLSVFKDANAARTEIGIDNSDQRLVLGSFYESGGLQYATIQSTNNAESSDEALVLQPDGGNVGIGTVSPSAPLEVASTTGGVIMPRMTTTQKNAISSPTNGEMVYDTTDNKFYGYANGSWVAFH